VQGARAHESQSNSNCTLTTHSIRWQARVGAIISDVTTTLAYYGRQQVNREKTMGTGHKGITSGT
jgi:hypothetical protein